VLTAAAGPFAASAHAAVAQRCFLNTKTAHPRPAGASRASEGAPQAPSRPRGTLGDDLGEAGDDVREAGGGEHGVHLWAQTAARRAESPIWCFLNNSESGRLNNSESGRLDNSERGRLSERERPPEQQRARAAALAGPSTPGAQHG
jgi:hypothetical protein